MLYGINSRRKLIKNLDKSYYSLLKAYEYMDREKEIVPAGEWLLDNLYLIEKEYKDIKHNMPSRYYKDLPILAKGNMRGFPRIYNLALEIVTKTDGRVEEINIEALVKEFQNVEVLTCGELWVLPIMLRIALIQNIGVVVEKILFSQKEKDIADKLADRLIYASLNKKTPSGGTGSAASHGESAACQALLA